MKTIIFPATNRVHRARQQLLLKELEQYFNVVVWEPDQLDHFFPAARAIEIARQFNVELYQRQPDCVLIRADRMEMLNLAFLAAYYNSPVVHLEGGDKTGVIDDKVRHAISHLADYHFPTNNDSAIRLTDMGIAPDRIWNFGSLDVELAAQVEPKRLIEDPYLVCAYHPINGEDENEVMAALDATPEWLKKIVISSNKDYGRQYGTANYSPEDYINVMRFANVIVGNSSSLFKEASITGVGVINVGDRQQGRLAPSNMVSVPCQAKEIEHAISYQLDKKYEPDYTYCQENTAKRIAAKLGELIHE